MSADQEHVICSYDEAEAAIKAHDKIYLNPCFCRAPAKAGKAKAVVCTGCHGADGVSVVPNYPNLAGQKEAYLVKALKDYQSGARNEPLMVPIVQGLSEEDIRNLAAYFSSLK